MRPTSRRRLVGQLQGIYQVSERRALRATGFARSTQRYRSRRDPQAALRMRLKELAAVRDRYGYRRLHVLLRREGWPVNAERLFGNYALTYSPAFVMLDVFSRLFSPYQFNPLNLNPLRTILEETVDFDRLRSPSCPVKLFLSATNVRTGKIKVFGNDELSADAAMASACLPFLFHAVEIAGEHYWDGGYMGNPAIFPLIYNCKSADVVVVHINPLERAELPRSATDIHNRINEISFTSSLMREMRAISFVTRLIDEGSLSKAKARRVLVHAIEANSVMSGLGVASKLNADWDFLCHLRQTGRDAAEEWLEANFDRLNVESSIDIRARYL